ncbi:MAG: helix-turn-helix domain-containing protein [Christensenellaceae bacterium]|jgi:toxin-antitoxin system, antitoxin component, xre family
MRLKELREERHLTQNDIAKEIKTSQTNIGRWEKELNEPAASFLIRLADFFQCSIDYLLGREDDLGNITIHTEKPAPLPQDEQELLNIYQALSPAHRSQILEYARYFAEKSGVASTRRKA